MTESKSRSLLNSKIPFCQIRTHFRPVAEILFASEDAKSAGQSFIAVFLISRVRFDSAFADGLPNFFQCPFEDGPILKDLTFPGSQNRMRLEIRQFLPMRTFLPPFPGHGQDFGFHFCRVEVPDELVNRSGFQPGAESAFHAGEHSAFINVVGNGNVGSDHI